MNRIGLRVLAGVASAGTAISFGLIAHGGVVRADDSIYECNQYGGHQVALRVNHTTGLVTHYPGTTTAVTIQKAVDDSAGDTTTSGSGAGDTVIVCQGTYTGNLNIAVNNDNLTVRSEEGPGQSTIVGDGTAPVVTIDDRGLSFGGPAEGLTISVANKTGNTNTAITGIQVGVPGAQSTANEDEQCAGVPVSPTFTCDSAAPADVTYNDQIIDNDLKNFRGLTSSDTVTGIKLDNTINTVVQQNALLNVIPDNTAVASFEGIVVGGIGETASSPAPTGFGNGDSTNINTALFQNTIANVFQGSHSTCSSKAEGIELNGFMLDSQVYNNWLQQLYQNSTACAVTGIASDAYGSLENEQTGTLAPVNANIDNNSLEQLGPNGSKTTTGVLLAPNPPSTTPPTGCMPAITPGCQDSIPPSSYTVVQNEIQNVYFAVHDEALLGSNSFIRFNNFDGDVIGVENDATAGAQNVALDATNDWWGCESGPIVVTAPNGLSNHGCAELVTPAGDTSWAPNQSSRVEGAGDDAGNNAGNS